MLFANKYRHRAERDYMDDLFYSMEKMTYFHGVFRSALKRIEVLTKRLHERPPPPLPPLPLLNRLIRAKERALDVKIFLSLPPS